jgi:hypothetical protein
MSSSWLHWDHGWTPIHTQAVIAASRIDVTQWQPAVAHG